MNTIILSRLGVTAGSGQEEEEEVFRCLTKKKKKKAGVKTTLLEITTATLNVLHYKICDKTFL